MKILLALLTVVALIIIWWPHLHISQDPLGKVDDMGEPSADPGVKFFPLNTPRPIVAKDLSDPYGDYAALQIDRVGRLLGQCIPTNKKLKVGTPYARMYFRINDINYLCERQ